MRIANRRRPPTLSLLGLAATLFLPWSETISRADSRKQDAVGWLPLSFELNRGQAGADAKFIARGSGYALLLNDRGEPVLGLEGRPHRTDEPRPESDALANRALELPDTADRALLRLAFPGSNPAPQRQAEQLLPGQSNYLIGNDPGKWLTGIPHYARVRYRDVFPGIDVLYYVKDGQLEYDFIVLPGANPDTILMGVHGAQTIEPREPGNLALKTAAGTMLLRKPTAYQSGPDGEQEVACNYLLENDGIRFVLGDYDRTKVLRIDPVLSYSALLDASIQALAVDASGNSYLAGHTVSTTFPTTSGAFQPMAHGAGDAVIAKLDPAGSLLFATYLGGSSDDWARSIALDSSGNVIVVGSTSSADFPVNRAFQSNLLGSGDAFISKLDGNGKQLLYSTYLGGSGADSALGVALDSSGRAVVTGETSSSNFPTSSGAFQAVYGGGDDDAFIAKLDTAQSGTPSLLFSTYLGGKGVEWGSAIAVDAAGSALVTGATSSANFPTVNAVQSVCASCANTSTQFGAEFDAFVSKLNADGVALVYSTFLGGSDRDVGNAITLDSAGNAHVAGTTFSPNFPTTANAFQTSPAELSDAFVTKLNATGSALVYSTFLGGDYFDNAMGIALDRSGNAFVTGTTQSWDFPTVNPLQGPGKGVCDFFMFPDSCSDAVVSQLSADGSSLIFSTYLGKADVNESGTGIAVDAAGNVYVAGAISTNTERTGFVARLGPVGTQSTSATLTTSLNPSNQGQSVTFTATVTPVGATGPVVIHDGNEVIGTASLRTDGTATFSTGSLSSGRHSIVAQYHGDSTFAASTSAALAQVVNSISLTAPQAFASVSKGGTATFSLTVSQGGELNSAIAFSCAGLPAEWHCGFSPATIPAGSGPTQVTLSVRAGSAPAQSFHHTPSWRLGFAGRGLPGVLAVVILGTYLSVRGRKATYLRPRVALGLAGLLLLAAGCGSGDSGSSETPQAPQAVTLNFNVSATSGATTASMPFRIVVN